MACSSPLPNLTVACIMSGVAAFGPAGFDYCAPPIVPTCIAQVAQTRSQADILACSPRVLVFARVLGAYRMCLQHESERAVAAGNDAIARFRCLSLGRKSCGPVHGATER